MAITLPCPSCKTSLTFADTLLGRTVKCKECGNPVEVKAPAAKARPAVKKVEEDEDDEPVRPKKKAAAKRDDDDEEDRPRKSSKKSSTKKRRDDDDDEDDAPKKSMVLPIAIGGGVLVLIVGGVLAAMSMGGKEKEKDVAVVTKPAVEPKPKPTVAPPPTTAETGKSEPASNPPTPIVEPPKVTKVEPVVTPSRGPAVVTKRPSRETPDAETMDKMMKASVYIEVDDGRGGIGSGSGWLGLEPNLIFTNAHVLSMKAPNSPAPKKITCYLNAGQKGAQVEIPHAKLKLLAVDRDMDLAVLEVINMKLPDPLTVRPTQQLGILEKLVALGYPGGRRLSRNSKSTEPPAVTVSQTQVQSFRNDDNGNLYALQVQGGIVHGNSGGPLCDADGNCIGVAVRVDIDNRGQMTNIAYGVPTEYVTGLLAGRIANVEYGQAYYKDGNVAIPVKVRCLDPRKRLQEVGIAGWVGDDEMSLRPPGTALSNKPSDSGLKEVKLNYNAAKQEATGELVFPPQQAGRSYWCQPYYVNSISPKYFMGGNKVKMNGSPVDQVPADLVAKYKIGSKRTVTITSTRDITEYDEGEEEDRDERELTEMVFELSETVAKPADASSMANLVYGFKKFGLGKVEGTQSARFPRALTGPIEALLKGTTLTAKANKQGELTMVSFLNQSTELNNPMGGPPMPPQPGMQMDQQLQSIMVRLGNQAFDTIRKGSITLPAKQMAAGESWTGTIDISVKVQQAAPARPVRPTPGQPNPGTAAPAIVIKEYKAREELTYTYLGLRDQGGKKEIVVLVEGVVVPAKGAKPDSASGRIKGIVRLELATGMVVESEIKHEYEIDTSEKGLKKRISGIEEFKLSRGPSGT